MALKTLGERVLALRTTAGLTQEAAAKLAKIKQPSWHAIETKTTPAHIKAITLLRVAKALNASPFFLLTGEGVPMSLTANSDGEITLLASYRDLRAERTKGEVLGFLARAVAEQPGASGSGPFKAMTPTNEPPGRTQAEAIKAEFKQRHPRSKPKGSAQAA